MFDPGPDLFSSSTKNKSTIFLPKLEDKQTLENVIFRGEVYLYWNLFEKQDNVPYDEMFNANPPTADHKLRFKTNILIKENGAWTAKIWDNSNKVRKQLIDLKNQYGDLSEIFFNITRNGLKTATTYSIMPVFEGRKLKDLTPEDKKQIATIKLHDLKPKEETPF